MNKLGRLSAILAFAGLASVAGPASAVVITGTGNDQVDFSFSSLQGGVTLSGTVNIDVTTFNTVTNQVVLNVTLSNTTPGATIGTNRWTAFGFGSAPDADSVSFSDDPDAGMISASLDFIPGFNKIIEVCVWGGENCKGGASGGLLEQTSDSFVLTLNYATSIASGVTLDPYAVKFQSVGATGGSYEFGLCDSTPDCEPPTRVSEPVSIALLGFGLTLLGFAGARRRRHS